jgi:short-subunit dehydrogenase
MSTLKERWALVTGASSGLGADFARLLAEQGAHVVLVARREDRLRKLAAEIEGAHGVRSLVLPVDLGERDAPREVYERIRQEGIPVDVLVNNAGFGTYGEFVDIPWEQEEKMLQVDIVALVHLTKLFLKDMVERNLGHVLLVSSIGAYQPTPTYATYAASKAFVLSFGEAISYEVRNTKVRVSVLSPGVTATEFLQVAGQRPNFYQRLAMMQSPRVAQMGLRAMLQGRASRVAGLLNRLSAFSMRFVPRRMAAALAERMMR